MRSFNTIEEIIAEIERKKNRDETAVSVSLFAARDVSP